MKSFYFAFCIALTVYATQSFGAEAGMPQLNPEFWAAQIFWLLLFVYRSDSDLICDVANFLVMQIIPNVLSIFDYCVCELLSVMVHD
jgi:hypothetical protein